MRISSFSLVAVLSCVSVILAIPIEGRTPVTGIDRRQPDETNLLEVAGNLVAGVAGTLHVGSGDAGSSALGPHLEGSPVVETHDRRQVDGADSVNALLPEIENAIGALLRSRGLPGLDSLPVTENDCRNLGDSVDDLLNQILGLINGILSGRGRPSVSFISLTQINRVFVLTPIQIRINAILGACRLSLVAIVLDV